MTNQSGSIVAVAHEMIEKNAELGVAKVVLFSTDPEISERSKIALDIDFEHSVWVNDSKAVFDNISIDKLKIVNAVTFQEDPVEEGGIAYIPSRTDYYVIFDAVKELLISSFTQHPNRCHSGIKDRLVAITPNNELIKTRLTISKGENDYLYFCGNGSIYGSLTATSANNKQYQIVFTAPFSAMNYVPTYSGGVMVNEGSYNIADWSFDRVRALDTQNGGTLATNEDLADDLNAVYLHNILIDFVKKQYKKVSMLID